MRTLVANMTEPARVLSEGRPAVDLTRGAQLVVHEPEGERAREIASEFYPELETVATEYAESADPHSENDDQLSRICEAARRLGYNNAKTRMLVGQFAGNLKGLERKLLNELDERPGEPAGAVACRQGEPAKNATRRFDHSNSPDEPSAVPGTASFGEGYLY